MTKEKDLPVLRALRQQFAAKGYKAKFLKDVIPTWWTTEAEADPGAIEQLKLILANRLGLDIQKLIQDSRVEPYAPAGMSFRRSSSMQQEEPPTPNLAYYLAIVRALVPTVPVTRKIPATALAIRKEILASSEPFVSLSGLIDYCWSHSIPVIPVHEKVGEIKGTQALVFPVEDRRFIILTEKIPDAQAAKASFYIAHEIAHIALGHVDSNVIFLDEEIGEANRSYVSSKENDADSFALTLLSGKGYDETWASKGLRAPDLAECAERFGLLRSIDPGHILLRYARDNSSHYPQAAAALNVLNKKIDMTPGQLVSRAALNGIDMSLVGAEAAHLIQHAINSNF